MIDDNDGQVDFDRFCQGFNRRRAAINCDDQVGAALFQVTESFRARAIALHQTVRHIQPYLLPPGAEIAGECGGTGAAIDIIIRKHRDFLSSDNRVERQLCGFHHVLEAFRVRKQRSQSWIEECINFIRFNPARRQ